VILPRLPLVKIPFRSSERASLGVEWELQLVDRETRELSSGAVEILEEIRPEGAEEHPKAKHELLQSTIEIITGICGTAAEAKSDLAGTLAEVVTAAERRGLGMLCAGTHPFTDWRSQQISPKPRYLELVERMQWLARRLQIFGVHVHVGVRAPEKAIPIVNALTQYVPHFLALSASSPFWKGADTGLASARSKVFEGMPTAGLPYQLSGWDHFEEYMETLISTHAIESVREVWWDIRPHPDFGTVELRICDGLPTLDEIGAVTALSQCLVEQFDTQLDRGYTLPTPAGWVLRENKWRAARYGLDADIVVDEKGTVRPVRQAILDLVEELEPTARRLDCSAELADVERVLAVGASYQRQRAVAAAHDGDLTAVVDSLMAELRDGLPARPPSPRPGGDGAGTGAARSRVGTVAGAGEGTP
jgi:YbdK family carboxylate-amine ligase